MVMRTINVSGVKFEFNDKLLLNHPGQTLAKLCKDVQQGSNPNDDAAGCTEIVVERPAEGFAAVLAFYQTGELHMPVSMCPRAFRRELQFWNVNAADLQQCCAFKYYGFLEEINTHEDFREKTKAAKHIKVGAMPTSQVGGTASPVGWRMKIWKITDYQETSTIAKIYLAVVFAMVIFGITIQALATDPQFQRKLSRCEYIEYLEHTEYKHAHVVEKAMNVDCSKSSIFDDDWVDYDHDGYEFDSYDDYGNLSKIQVNTKELRTPIFILIALDYIPAIFFTIDFIVRFACCPSKRKFVMSLLNICDFVALAGFYIYVLYLAIEKEHKYIHSWIEIFHFLQILRIMRLFRVVNHLRASRVLAFSLKQNLLDMSFLGMLMLIFTCGTASLVYFLEDRTVISSVPNAWYWSIITLTTVGYGDISPETGGGRALACVMSICGVLLLAVTLPMFVNNFLTLYQYAYLDDFIEDKKAEDKGQGRVQAKTVVDAIQDHSD